MRPEIILIIFFALSGLFLFRVERVYAFKMRIIRLDDKDALRFYEKLPSTYLMWLMFWRPLTFKSYFEGVDVLELENRYRLSLYFSYKKDKKADRSSKCQFIVIVIVILSLLFILIYPIL